MKFKSIAVVFMFLAMYGLEAWGQTMTSGMFGQRNVGGTASMGMSTFSGSSVAWSGMGMSSMGGMGGGMSSMGMSGMGGGMSSMGMGSSGLGGMGMSSMGSMGRYGHE